MTKIMHFEDRSMIADTNEWRAFIELLEYRLVEVKEYGGYRFEIFQRNADWALYHPAIAGTDTEVFYAYIPGREQVDALLDFAIQMIDPITSLAQIRSMFNPPE